MTHFHYDMGYSESTFSKYAFGRGGEGHKKEYAVYARENDDNYGRPLNEESRNMYLKQLPHKNCSSQIKLIAGSSCSV